MAGLDMVSSLSLICEIKAARDTASCPGSQIQDSGGQEYSENMRIYFTGFHQ